MEGPRGTEVKLRFAEALDDRGWLNTCINRSALKLPIPTHSLKKGGVEILRTPLFYLWVPGLYEVTGYRTQGRRMAWKPASCHTAVGVHRRLFPSSLGTSCSIKSIKTLLYGQLANP